MARRVGNLRVQFEAGGDAEMGAELARKHLDRIAGVDDAKGRTAEAEHLVDLEAIVVERRHVALRRFEHGRIRGEAARGEKRQLETERSGMAAMRRFGHGAGIGQYAAGARGCDADGVGELSRIEFQDMSGRDRRAERTDGAGRMKSARACLELSGGLANPALHLHAFDQRGQNLAAGGAARLGERQYAGERSRQRVIGRAPHRLEVEHVHGGAVERRRRHRIETETIADRRCLRPAALLLVIGGEDLDRFFLGAGDRNGDAVEHQPPCGLDRGLAEIVIVGRGDPFAKLGCHRHCGPTFGFAIGGRCLWRGSEEADRVITPPWRRRTAPPWPISRSRR